MELAFIQYQNQDHFRCAHFEAMRDGTPHFTLRLNGLLTYDLSGEVGLRWKSLPEKTSGDLLAGIWVFVLLRVFFHSSPRDRELQQNGHFCLGFNGH